MVRFYTPARFLRVRDAELSVRTANALCRKFGNDLELGHVFEMTDADLKMAGLGVKGIREIRELIELCRVNGTFEPLAPPPVEQAELRDQFAMRAMATLIGGMGSAHREEVLDGVVGGKRISRAAYMYAGAMLEARRA